MFSPVNDAVLSTFSEPFTYKGIGGDVLLQGVFAELPATDSLGNVTFGDRTFALDIPKTALDTHNIEIRQTVNVRGDDYQIINLQTDETGFSTLTLRRYS